LKTSWKKYTNKQVKKTSLVYNLFMITFKEMVLKIVKDIPRGKTMTYKQVALLAGSPGAARAVGSIMSSNFRRDVPCHRVIRSDGVLGDYNRGGTSEKRMLLRKEGAIFKR
jgi:methylated-DNA-[protein]-cysteine S-methyltransferase